MEYYSVKCPNCKKVVEAGTNRKTQYGSPFRKCQHCGHTYADANYIEAGLYDEAELNKKSFKWICGAALLFVSGAYFVYGGIVWSRISVGLIGILLLALCVFCIISNLKYHPRQDERLQKEIRESKERLSNPYYVIALWKAECHVTPELLAWAKKAVAEEAKFRNEE